MSAFSYILVDREVVPVTFEEWVAWHDGQPGKHPSMTTQIAKDAVGGVRVSTVFLGIDHGFGQGAPVVFETMTFGEPFEQLCWRYTSQDAAEAGHARIVAALIAGEDLNDFD